MRLQSCSLGAKFSGTAKFSTKRVKKYVFAHVGGKNETVAAYRRASFKKFLMGDII